MSNKNGFNKRLSSKIEIEFPDFTKLPERVKQKFESLPTKVNFFRMLGYSPGTFVEIIDLTNAIFKNLTLSNYHKELLVVLVAAHEGSNYEWEQHFIAEEYSHVIQERLLAPSLDAFRLTFRPRAFTDEKVIESLIWAFTALLNKGELVDERTALACGTVVRYSARTE